MRKDRSFTVQNAMEFIDARQRVRATACAHFDLDACDTKSELEDLEPCWVDSLTVLADPATGGIRAAVCFEWEEDLSCAWMYGPWVDGDYDDDVARAVQRACEGLGCAQVRGLFPSENKIVLRGLDRSGWTRSRTSLITCTRRGGMAPIIDTEGLAVAQPDDQGWIGALHQELFNGAYLSAAEMMEGRRSVLVDPSHSGYVAYGVQADGVGYVDYLGVDPAKRRKGTGRSLLRGALTRMVQCPVVRLTTESDNHAALQLFASEGFDESVLLIGTRWEVSL